MGAPDGDAWPVRQADPGPGQWPDPPTPPFGLPVSRWARGWGVGAYLLVEVVFLVTSVVVGALVLGDGGPPSAAGLAVALGVPTLLAAGVAVLVTRLRGNWPPVDLGLRWSWRDVGLGFAFGFGGLCVTIPVSLIYVAIVGQDTPSTVGDLFDKVRAGPAMASVIFVLVVFVAPVCEEIVYRGLLWGGVELLGAGRWMTLGVTTVVFALAHLEPLRAPLLLIVAIPIGLARLHTGRLVAGIVAHQVNNVLPGVVLVLGLLGLLPAG